MSFPSFKTEAYPVSTPDVYPIESLFKYSYVDYSSDLPRHDLNPEEKFNSGLFRDEDTMQEVHLSPEGVPHLYGAESLGVFLNLPEVLNLSSSCSDVESISSQSDLTSEERKEKKLTFHRKRVKSHKILDSSRKEKRLKDSIGRSNDQCLLVRKRGRPRKNPVSNTAPVNPINYFKNKPPTHSGKNTNVPVRKKPSRLCTQCNTWFSDKSTLNRHIRSRHKIFQTVTQDEILTAWSSLDLSSTSEFSLDLLYRVKLNPLTYIYPTQVTQDSLFFQHPMTSGANGVVSRSDKNILRLMNDGSYSYTAISEIEFLSVCWHSIPLTSRLQFDTHSLYRVRFNSQQHHGCFYSTEITPYSIIMSLPESQCYAKVDCNVKDKIKIVNLQTDSHSSEFSVARIEKLYCFWRRESLESENLFKTEALYRLTVMNKNVRSFHTSYRTTSQMLSFRLASRTANGELSSCEKKNIKCKYSDDATLTSGMANLIVSKLDSMCSHWTWTSRNAEFYKNSVYRVIVTGTNGQYCKVLITTISPFDISFTPVLPRYLPTSHQESFVSSSSYSADLVNSICNFVEETNLPWTSVDIADKRQKFNPWKLYRVQPFNHTNQSPNRLFICTVICREVLHFSDPYSKNNFGVVSFSTKNIYDSISRNPHDHSTCVSFPLTAMHDLGVSWTMVLLHSQAQFDTGYIYMVQISNQGHLFNLISLCVAVDLLLFDAPNETGMVGKLHSSNKLEVDYLNASGLGEVAYSVISLRFMTGVEDEKQSH